MSRTPRLAPGGHVYHVLNRGNDRHAIFESDADYAAFLKLIVEAQNAVSLDILAYCVMPNHWHFVVTPAMDGQLGRFLQRLTGTHARRWRLFRGTVGEGHLYQGRFKSFPVQDDAHFYAVCRYVEQNPLRAGLVPRAENWRWSSLAQRAGTQAAADAPRLAAWPVPLPDDWAKTVNLPQVEEELLSLRRAAQQGRPIGHLARRGRPRKMGTVPIS